MNQPGSLLVVVARPRAVVLTRTRDADWASGIDDSVAAVLSVVGGTAHVSSPIRQFADTLRLGVPGALVATEELLRGPASATWATTPQR